MLPIADAQREVAPIRGFEHFQEWSRLVWAHTPGQLDEAARAIAAWPAADLFEVRTDLWAAVKLMAGAERPGGVAQYTVEGEWIPSTQMARPTARPRTLRSDDLPDLL